jgi:hypothetical protein
MTSRELADRLAHQSHITVAAISAAATIGAQLAAERLLSAYRRRR